jgi:hypothetical protein
MSKKLVSCIELKTKFFFLKAENAILNCKNNSDILKLFNSEMINLKAMPTQLFFVVFDNSMDNI